MQHLDGSAGNASGTMINKRFVSPARQQLVEYMYEIYFGLILDLTVRNGDPVMQPRPEASYDWKLGTNRERREVFNRNEFVLTVVETGTIRAEEDWGGAGFFTYLAGAYLYRKGGRLHSVDVSEPNCRFARAGTQVFGDAARTR